MALSSLESADCFEIDAGIAAASREKGGTERPPSFARVWLLARTGCIYAAVVSSRIMRPALTAGLTRVLPDCLRFMQPFLAIVTGYLCARRERDTTQHLSKAGGLQREELLLQRYGGVGVFQGIGDEHQPIRIGAGVSIAADG